MKMFIGIVQNSGKRYMDYQSISHYKKFIAIFFGKSTKYSEYFAQVTTVDIC